MPVCASTINRVLGGFITSFPEYVASYINNIAVYENYFASTCLELPLNCASGGFREQLNQSVAFWIGCGLFAYSDWFFSVVL